MDSNTRSEIQVKYSDSKPYFLFVAAIHPRKNLQRLIPAFEKYKLNNPDSNYQLVIVGTELWSNSGANLEIDPSIKAQIHFTGHLPLDQLAQVVASATVFTFVPYFEGFENYTNFLNIDEWSTFNPDGNQSFLINSNAALSGFKTASIKQLAISSASQGPISTSGPSGRITFLPAACCL